MYKTVLVSEVLAICLVLGIAAGVLAGVVIEDRQQRAGVEPSPWTPIRQDLTLFQKEIDPSKGKLAEARPGANLINLGLLKSHEKMMGLLQSLRTKVKGLEEARGQEKQVLDVCNKMKPKLDSLELFLKNFNTAIKQGDKPSAQRRLNEIEETVKGLEALLAQ